MKRLLTLALLLCLLAVAHAQTPKPAAFFPVSVWYAGGRARAPMLEPVTPDSRRLWREDLVKIKSLGFNTVRTWVDWSAAEPRQGEYHLEQLDLMLSLAEEVGLKVMVQVYVDSAPDWVGEKFPDAKFVAQNGQPIPSQSAPGFCFDHPGVRQAVLAFYKEVARRAGKSPVFFGWDLWSEPHVINWAEITYIPHASFCYCPYTLARFREWLRHKYGTLDALNRAWYRNFRDWAQVEPPRFDTILSYTDFMDWRVFITEKLAEDLKLRDAAVKEIAPGHVTTSHSAVPGVFTSLADGDGNPDDWLMYRSVDYYGVSLYPKHSLPPHWSLARRALAMDFTRSASGNRGFYVGELQGGFGVRGDVVRQEITPQDLQLYLWGAVSRGARGINVYALYPMSSGYESGGYGLINLDGTLTERSKVAGETAKLIAANADMLLQSHPRPAEVAILFNHLTTLIGGQQHLYNPTAVRDSTAGYHRIFLERNIAVDFISARELDATNLAPYKLIVVPYPIMLMSNVAAALEEYVKNGGHLFTEARPGWVDDRGYAQPVVPGFGWAKMLAVRESSVTPQPEVHIRWGDKEFLAGRFQERFTVLDATATPVAFFEDGSPAAFEHRFGQGSAMILGSFAGQMAETKPVDRHPLGDVLTHWAGLSEPSGRFDNPVEIQELDASQTRFVFVFNHGSQTTKGKVVIPIQAQSFSTTEIITGTSVPGSGKELTLPVEVPAQSVRVYRIDFHDQHSFRCRPGRDQAGSCRSGSRRPDPGAQARGG